MLLVECLKYILQKLLLKLISKYCHWYSNTYQMHTHKIKAIDFSEECTKIACLYILISRFDVMRNVKGKAMDKV